MKDRKSSTGVTSFFGSIKNRILFITMSGIFVLSVALIHYAFTTSRSRMIENEKAALKQTVHDAYNDIESEFERVRMGRTTLQEARERIIRRLAGPLQSIRMTAEKIVFQEKVESFLQEVQPEPPASGYGIYSTIGSRKRVVITDKSLMRRIYSIYADASTTEKDRLEKEYGLWIKRDISRTSVKKGKDGYMYIARVYDPDWLLPGTNFPADYTEEKITKRFAQGFTELPGARAISRYKRRFGTTAEKQLAFIKEYMTAPNHPPNHIRIISHPILGFRNVDNLKTHDGKRIGRHIAIAKSGKYEYWWKNPGEKNARKKFAFFRYYEYRDASGKVDPRVRWVITGAAYEDESYASIESLRRDLYFRLSIPIALLFILISYIALRTIFVNPLNRLITAMRTVDSGNLNARADASGANEISYLARSFNSMIASIRLNHMEMAELNTAYERFVPVDFLRILGRRSIVDVRLGDQIEKEMTVFFADIRSFTTISENMSPEENFAFINSYLNRMGPVIRNAGGFIDKYIGDAVMALFPGSADSALEAALKMQIQLQEFNEEHTKNGRDAIRIGIGIHTGKLMLGTVGEEERMEGTVISDAVNLAARMEKLTKTMGVTMVISEKTLAALADPTIYNYRFLGSVRVKGKEDRVAVFEVYDGDSPELSKLKSRSQGDLELGIQKYHTQEYEISTACFRRVLGINPDDRAAKIYLKRSLNKIDPPD